MSKIIILGSGAAPGVPSLSQGFGDCNPSNLKNIRTRTSIYYEFGNTKILVDTSPDLRLQLIQNQIRQLDAVLYTHVHADHLHGIDDLREINRISGKGMNIYLTAFSLGYLRERFAYLLAQENQPEDVVRKPCLYPNVVAPNQCFYVKDVKITPLRLIGHNIESIGYAFNDGEIVHIADFKKLDKSIYAQLKTRPKILLMPLTTPYGQQFHAGLEEVMAYVQEINPEKVILNHLASECDYDTINEKTPDYVIPAFDNMTIEF